MQSTPGRSAVGRVYSNLRGLRTVLRDAGRMRAIAAVLARHGYGAVVQRLGLDAAEAGEAAEELPPLREREDAEPQAVSVLEADAPLDRGRRIRRIVEELGPTFIKLAQILSTRPDLIPADILEALQELQDNVPPMALAAVEAQLEAERGAPGRGHFHRFEERPLACASIAQVHGAELEDGTRVVVKVQRPDILSTIESDLQILYFIARRAEALLPELTLVDPVGIVREFDRALRRELDFSFEEQHLVRMRANFEDFEGVRVPVVYPELSTSRVLVMERMAGVKVTRASEVLGVDPYVVAPRMLRALFKMVFQDGFFHGDLHPGNILIDEDGTISLIDLGLVGRLSPQQRDNILDVLVGIARQDYVLVSRVFFEIGIKVPGVSYDYDRFEADVVDLMEQHIAGRTLSRIDVGAFFTELVTGCLRHEIKMPPTYTMVFKALMTVEGIGRTLAPEINFVEEAQPFVEEVMMERYAPARLMREGVETLTSLSRFLRVFPHASTQVLRDVQQGRLVLNTEVRNLSRLEESARQAAQVQARAMVAGAALVAGTLALGGPGESLLGLPLPALLLYALAGIVGVPILLRSLRG